MVKIGGADYCTFTNNQKKLLHTIFNGGDAGGTLTEGEENFFIWSRLVVPIIAHSPMVKGTSSYNLQWWWRWWNTHRTWRKLLHMVKIGGADDSTFTDGQEDSFIFSGIFLCWWWRKSPSWERSAALKPCFLVFMDDGAEETKVKKDSESRVKLEPLIGVCQSC